MQLIYLQWADATVLYEGWQNEEEAIEWADTESFWIEHIGWVLKETKDYLLLVSARSTATKGSKSDIKYEHVHKIPKTWIRKRKIIKI